MLTKLKVTLIIGVVIQVLRVFVPALEVPDNFGSLLNSVIESIWVVIPIIAGWFTKESQENIDNLDLS
jgi:ACR3 family arsenite efflux pump ArsB